MGSGNSETPDYTSISDVLFGGNATDLTNAKLGGWQGKGKSKNPLLPGGEEFYKSFMEQYKEGLPKDIQEMYTKQGKAQIGSQLEEGRQNLSEQLAGSGSGVPLDALIGANSRLQTGANKAMAGLTDQLAMRNYGAKQEAFGNYANLMGLATGQGNSNNAFNMQKYQIDEENKFKWGDAIGGALGVGGALGGQAISRKG